VVIPESIGVPLSVGTPLSTGVLLSSGVLESPVDESPTVESPVPESAGGGESSPQPPRLIMEVSRRANESGAEME